MKPTSEDVAKWIRESPTTYEIPSFIAGQAYKAGTAAQLERMLAGVEMPEPAYVCAPYDPITGQLTRVVVNYYTADQYREGVAAVVAKKNAYAIACQNEADALRASRDEYQRAADDMAMEHKVERDALKAENEKLQAQTNERGALAIANGIRMERAEAENERNNVEMVWLTVERESWRRVCETITIERDALKAENERLRAALKDAVEFTREWGYFDVAKAEAALKGQP